MRSLYLDVLRGLCRSENLKLRHTATAGLWYIMPALTMLLAYGISRSNGTESAYNWWYTIMMPGMITLYCCMIGEKDKKMKNRTVLAFPFPARKIWDAKVISGIKMLIYSNVFFASGNLSLSVFLLPAFGDPQVMKLTLLQAAAGAGIIIMTALWQIPFCLWLEQKTGFFPAVFINMIMNGSGTIMAATGYWIVNPWAVLPRLMICVTGILPNGLPAVPGSMTYSPEMTEAVYVLPGMAVTGIIFAVMWGCSRMWYERKGAETV